MSLNYSWADWTTYKIHENKTIGLSHSYRPLCQIDLLEINFSQAGIKQCILWLPKYWTCSLDHQLLLHSHKLV